MEPRPATIDDVDEVLRLAIVMFDALGVTTDDASWEVEARARFVDGLHRGMAAAFVVDNPEHPGRLVASAAVSVQQRLPTPATPNGRVAYVQWVATEPQWRRRGLSGAAMEQVVAWAAAQGVASVDLHASEDGERLYRAMGFSTNGRPELRLRLPRPAAT